MKYIISVFVNDRWEKRREITRRNGKISGDAGIIQDLQTRKITMLGLKRFDFDSDIHWKVFPLIYTNSYVRVDSIPDEGEEPWDGDEARNLANEMMKEI